MRAQLAAPAAARGALAARPRRPHAARASPAAARAGGEWRDALAAVSDAHARGGVPDAATLRAASCAPLPTLMSAAAAVRDAAFGSVVTFSPKVFIPLTRLCRDDCGYCTFSLRATSTDDSRASAFMSLAEVLAVARAGAAAGATEALFTLGDAPEAAHASAAAALRALGHASTLDYVAEAAAAVLNATGLLPHVNAGLCSAEQAALLKGCSVSQGLMLESTSLALHAPGGAHHGCATKLPAARLAAIDAAGAAGVPFTSGILIGIGETRSDRIDALLALRGSHERHGHLQEAIVQNFRAKGGTRMAAWPEPDEAELLWSVALARLALPGAVSLQAPPNLQRGADATWRALLCAGINDWGGVSPGVTRDHVNPEAPWPMLPRLAAAAASCGKALAPRLAVYPRFMQARWLSEAGGPASVAAAVRRAADAEGLARGHPFLAGLEDSGEADATSAGDASSGSAMRLGGLLLPPAVGAAHALRVAPSGAVPPDDGSPAGDVSPAITAILARAADGGTGLMAQPLSPAESALLFGARGAECDAVCAAADALRAAVCGGEVAYVVNRNINYTNVCTFGCTFCAFSKGPAAEAARGASYLLPPAEVGRRAAEAWARGATEVCLQGGIHPDFDGDTYLRYLAAVKAAAPDMHVHAFSPLEVTHGAQRSGRSVPSFLAALRDAGLGSLPGTAAEILDTRVRPRLCPDKLTAAAWCDVVSAAHAVGLRTTSTIMFGHLDDYEAWAQHLQAVRDVALAHPGMVTEFVPLPFVHPHAPVYRAGSARRGPTLRECLLMHAVGRLALHGAVRNVQASWVKMGPQQAAQLLRCGANDMGGVLMNESITRAAGAQHGQELGPAAMDALIRDAGRTPRQRTTLYGTPAAAQVAASYDARPLQPL